MSGRARRRVQQAFGKINLDGDLAKTIRESDRRALMDVVKQPALKDISPAAATLPLRLAIQGKPDWKEDFIQAQRDPAFDVWKPGRDLVWDHLNESEAKLFKDRGEGGAARWVLLHGSELLSSGGELPMPETLSDLLRSQGLPYLAELDAFIKGHPDHAEAREQRISEVSARTQTAGLEKRLLADFMQVRSIANFPKDWKPMRNYGRGREEAVAATEADTRRWPTTPVARSFLVTCGPAAPPQTGPHCGAWPSGKYAKRSDPFRTGPGYLCDRPDF